MSGKQSHTPGPWKVIDDDMDYIALTDADQETGVCTLELAAHFDRETMRANARLIAVAPEMLDALKRVSTLLAHGMPTDLSEILTTIGYVHAAIARAEGPQ